MTVIFGKDEYIMSIEEGTPLWVVTLSNGKVVYQDDDRPGEDQSGWERLYNYCKETSTYIIGMTIRFRDHVKTIPPNKDGYFFCRMSRGSFGLTKTFQFFVVGTLENGILTVTRWKVPEMLDDGVDIRNPTEAGICLIQRKDNEQA